MIRRIIIPILLLALGAAGLMALARSRPQPEPLKVEEKVWPVAVAPVVRGTYTPTLTLYARVDAPRMATLTSAVAADVDEVGVLEGVSVTVGQVLVRLDAREAWLEVTQREAEVAEIDAELAREAITHANDRRALELEGELLALIQRDVERAQQLASRDMGSASRLDEARQAVSRQMLALDNRRRSIAEHDAREAALRARRGRAQALLARARLDAERTLITAPFDGLVAGVFVSPGDRVRVGDRLLSTYDARSLEFRAQVPTRYLSRLRDGLAGDAPVVARARVDGAEVRARLDRLGVEVARGRGGADAFFRIMDPRATDIELGRTVELVVPLPAVDGASAIPQEALYGTDRVYLLVDGRMQGVSVQRLGERAAGDGVRRILVRGEALGEGATLITTQLPNAVDGLAVRVAQPR